MSSESERKLPHKLIEITSESHGVDLDIAYATVNNFTGKPVYGRAACYLLDVAEEKFRRAQALAALQGYRFKIFDAFRPAEAQWVLWNHTPDPDFLADPNRGSPHSIGVAIDLTLVDKNGNDLDMGTPFDTFSALSHHGNTDVSKEAQFNRYILLGIMTAAGWDCYLKEWWHYQLFNPRVYPVLGDAALDLPMMP